MANRTYIIVLAAAAATAALAGTGRADVNGNWGGSDQYDIAVSHVPDLDQKRNGLPGLGKAYCVPTAGMNWMAYFAQHGLPNFAPGSADWRNPDNYDLMTLHLTLMGVLMETDPDSGTGATDGIVGLIRWMNNTGYVGLVVRYSSDFDWSPTLRTVAHHQFNGAYVIPIVGWFDESDLPVIDREGGHALTLVRARESGSAKEIGWRDPARSVAGDTRDEQSDYTTETYVVRNVSRRPNFFFASRTMSKIVGYGSSKQGYIDGLVAIYPIFILSSYDDPLFLGITFHRPPSGGTGGFRGLELPEETPVRHSGLSADLSEVLTIADSNPPRLYRTNPFTGESEFSDLPVSNPLRMHAGRRRDLYVIDGPDLVCVNIDVDIPVEVARVTPELEPVAVTSNDKTDEIVVLTRHTLVVYPWHLEGEPRSFDLPDDFIPDVDENTDIVWDPERGGYWAASERERKLYRLYEKGTGLASEPYFHDDVREPMAIDIGDDGRIYVSDQGLVTEYEVSETGALMPVADPRFEGVRAGASLQIARNRTNHDPEIHEGPGWRHVEPEVFEGTQEIDCATDLDGSGRTDFGDVLAVLAAWGQCSPDEHCETDLDFSGATDFSDLLIVLAAWGPCPE